MNNPRFKEGWDRVENDERIGRPSGSVCEKKIDAVRVLKAGEQFFVTVEIIANALEILLCSVHTNLPEKLKLKVLLVKYQNCCTQINNKQ